MRKNKDIDKSSNLHEVRTPSSNFGAEFSAQKLARSEVERGEIWAAVSALARTRVRGLPRSERGWRLLVDREKWDYREVPGGGGKGGIRREYKVPSRLVDVVAEWLFPAENDAKQVGVADSKGSYRRETIRLCDIDCALLERIVIALEAAFLRHSWLIRAAAKLIDEHRQVLRDLASSIERDHGIEQIDAGPLVRGVMEKWIAYAIVECGAAVRIYNRVKDIEDRDLQTKMIQREVEFFTMMKTIEQPANGSNAQSRGV